MLHCAYEAAQGFRLCLNVKQSLGLEESLCDDLLPQEEIKTKSKEEK